MILAICIIVGLILLGPGLEMWIWNTVLIDLFAIPTVTYWQMFAINIFCTLLFGRVSSNSNWE